MVGHQHLRARPQVPVCAQRDPQGLQDLLRPAADVLVPLIDIQAGKQHGDDARAAHHVPSCACQPQHGSQIMGERARSLWCHEQSLDQRVRQSMLQKEGRPMCRAYLTDPYAIAIDESREGL
jgi:hypothetical protein